MKTMKMKRKGFTLIELLIGMAITTVIIGVLVGTTRMAMDAWQESRDKARASRLAKEGLDLMARDLEGVVIRSGNDFEWMYAKMNASEPLGPNGAEIKNPLEFVFFTAATDRYDGDIGGTKDKGGDVSTVMYRLVYKDQLDPAGNSFPVYSLYRKLVNPDVTFNDYLAKTDIQSVAGGQTVTESDNFLAENVYNLTVTFTFEYLETVGSTQLLRQQRVPIMASGSDFRELSIRGNKVLIPGASSTLPDNARLAGVELGIMVVSDSGMRGLNKKNFSDSAAFNKYLKQHSHYFTKSVLLPRP